MRNFPKIITAFAAISVVSLYACTVQARDNLHIVGSSTVFPFASIVAENFFKKVGGKPPVIESLGTGGGFKVFCSGVGDATPDIANASRAIKPSEWDDCQKNGVKEIIEIKIGIDGIVIAANKKAKPMQLTNEQLARALAEYVPNASGAMQKNPYKKWSDIDPKLPNSNIIIYGPPASSGTRDALSELSLTHAASKYFADLKAKSPNDFKTASTSFRTDGAYIEVGENDALIVNKLQQQPEAVGVFGYSFLALNSNVIQSVKIDNVDDSEESIASGKYPLSRPLFIYVKKANMASAKNLKGYIEEFVSEKAIGSDGYLTDKGLVPLPMKEREQSRNRVKTAENYKP